MRIFVSSVDQTGSRRNTRILLHNCASTTQLTKQICKQLNIPRSLALIKLKSDIINLIIIDNWLIQHYPIKSGSTFTVEIIQSSTNQNLQLAQPLYKIEEELFNEQQIESQDSPSNSSKSTKQASPQNSQIQLKYSHYLEQCLNRMLETVRKGSLEDISGLMKEEPVIADQLELQQLMKKKYQYLLNQTGDCGRNALHWAVHINHLDIVSFLLIKGASTTRLTIDNYSPLQLAIQHHSTAVVALLLQQPSFNINQTTRHGTALHLAVRNQDLKCIQLLLQNDASLDIPDIQNRLPLDICQNQNIKKILQLKAQMGKLPIPNIAKGQVYRVSTTTYRLKERNLLLNPFKNQFIFSELSGEVQQKLPLKAVEDVEQIKQKSWLMKSSLFYLKLIIKDKEKDLIIAVKNSIIQKRWIRNFKIAIKYQEFMCLVKPIAVCDQIVQHLDDSKGQIVLHKRKVQEKSAKKTQSIMNLKAEEQYQKLSPESKAKQLKKTAEGSEQNKSQEDQKLRESQIILGSVLQIKRLNSKSTPSSQSEFSETQNSPFRSETSSGHKFRKSSDNRVQIVSQFDPNPTPSISYVDFEIAKLLGNGAFGKVYLATYKKSGSSYALKVLNKKKLFSKKQLKYAVGQANILKKLDSPFIVKLYFAFQTPTNLYMALDHCSLGDLSELIISKEKLKQNTARFVIAQLVLAIEYLHDLKILYRDLKPQNILISADGYIRLTDFGLSRQNSFASSFCGSPAYLSPQMLQKKGVGLSSDIYGIGCVLYEMVVGEPPFYDENMDTLFQNIRSGKLRFPSYLSIEIKSLISRLLERDLTKRLGVKNINEIKSHDFFKKLDWQLLKNKRIAPPSEIFINADEQAEAGDIDLELNQHIALVDRDYSQTTKMINRVKNFTFIRQANEHRSITSLKCIKSTS